MRPDHRRPLPGTLPLTHEEFGHARLEILQRLRLFVVFLCHYSSTSQKSVVRMSEANDENQPADAGNDETGNQANSDSESSPPFSVPAKPTQTLSAADQPSKQPDKWWQDRKYVLELLGFIVLFAYTTFAGFQWLHIRWANKMTREALNGSNSSLQQTLDHMTWQIKETH